MLAVVGADKGFAERQYARIDPRRAMTHPVASGLPEHRDTIYLTVVDKDRNCCSFINSLYLSFGLFSLASLLGGLTIQWSEISSKIVMILTCFGILSIVFASYELIRESLLSWDIIKDHSEEVKIKE